MVKAVAVRKDPAVRLETITPLFLMKGFDTIPGLRPPSVTASQTPNSNGPIPRVNQTARACRRTDAGMTTMDGFLSRKASYRTLESPMVRTMSAPAMTSGRRSASTRGAGKPQSAARVRSSASSSFSTFTHSDAKNGGSQPFYFTNPGVVRVKGNPCFRFSVGMPVSHAARAMGREWNE